MTSSYKSIAIEHNIPQRDVEAKHLISIIWQEMKYPSIARWRLFLRNICDGKKILKFFPKILFLSLNYTLNIRFPVHPLPLPLFHIKPSYFVSSSQCPPVCHWLPVSKPNQNLHLSLEDFMYWFHRGKFGKECKLEKLLK